MYEVDMEPNWNEAPDEATHYLRSVQGGNGWWIKIDADGGYHHRMVNFHIWTHNHKDFFKTYDNDNWVVVARPQIQPKQQGEHKMFTAKQLKDTYPHKQMRLYIEATVADAAKRPAALGQLVKKFMANCEKEEQFDVPMDVDEAFTWANTPEGHGFWSIINGYRPKKAAGGVPVMPDFEAAFAPFGAPVAPVAPKKEAKAVPKPAHKQVGWW